MHIRHSAGGIVVRPDGKIVLVEQGGNSWSFPKGGIDKDEAILDAAMREIREETGISELTLKKDLGMYERYSLARDGVSDDLTQGLRERYMFLFQTPQTEAVADGMEITAVRFVTVDEGIALLTHPKDKVFLESVRDDILALGA